MAKRRMPAEVKADLTEDPADIRAASRARKAVWFGVITKRSVPPRVTLNASSVYLTQTAWEMMGCPPKAVVGVVDGVLVVRAPKRGEVGYTCYVSKEGGGPSIGTPQLVARLVEAGVPALSVWRPEWNEALGWLECRREES